MLKRSKLAPATSTALARWWPRYLLPLRVPGLHFGGVGASGMGAYHGRASF